MALNLDQLRVERTARRILISRLLTRSGDQAWDFAVPLTLVKLLPDSLQVAVVYYLVIRLGQALLGPRVGSLIDRWQRLRVAKAAIGLQMVGILGGIGALIFLPAVRHGGPVVRDLPLLALFVVIVVFGVVSSLGALMMEIAVANDIIPTVVPAEQLAHVNSRLKQIDLATEVGSPIVAGLLLTVSSATFPLLGFAIIAGWNFLSFAPEYLLIASVLKSVKVLSEKPLSKSAAMSEGLAARLLRGWRGFFAQPIMPSMVAYALLWLSVLSPHGVILTAFLKDGWHLSEPMIGVFRGLGAVFGLVSTVLFPWLGARHGLLAASRAFILFQAGILSAGLVLFFRNGEWGRIGFLATVLLSRIGLYGFGLGETQIRQVAIPEQTRGEVNSFASALTSVATLGLYGAGAIFANPADFHVLVVGSISFVVLGAVLFSLWSLRGGQQIPELKSADAVFNASASRGA